VNLNEKIPPTHGFIYFALMSSAALLAVAKYAIFAKLLEPDDFGLYNLVLTTYVFIVYAGGGGLNEALIKLGAVAKGAGEPDLIYRLRDVSIIYAVLATTVLGFIFWIGMRWFVTDQATLNTLALAAPLSVAVVGYNLVDASLRANQQLLYFSSMLLLKAVILLVVGYYAATLWGSSGVVVAEILSFFVVAILYLQLGGRSFDARNLLGGRALLRKAVRNGLPLLASMFLRNASLAMDRWVVAMSLGLTAIGKYAFAMIIYLVALTGLGFLTNLLGPRWLAQYSRDRDVGGLYKRIRSVAGAIALLAAVLIAPFFWGVSVVLPIYYPKYVGADTTWTMVYVYIGVVLLVCSYLFDWLFIATSNESFLLRISLIALGLTAIAMGVAYAISLDLVGFAIMFLIVRVATAVMYVVGVRTIIGRGNSVG